MRIYSSADTLGKWLSIAALACCPAAQALDQAVLTALLEDAHAEMKMPGLRAAVRLADGCIVRAAVGLADREAEIPLDDTVGMPGGSTGKSFVAALTMLLVEDGVLGLDDPASKWLAETTWYRSVPNAADIRVRHLLSHSAGIGDYPTSTRYRIGSIFRALRHGAIRFEPEELIAFAGRRPLFPVGQGFAYTDAGYLVLGRVIEAATGRAYYDLLRERILEPQGPRPGSAPGSIGASRHHPPATRWVPATCARTAP